jgi:hypothetical protein
MLEGKKCSSTNTFKLLGYPRGQVARLKCRTVPRFAFDKLLALPVMVFPEENHLGSCLDISKNCNLRVDAEPILLGPAGLSPLSFPAWRERDLPMDFFTTEGV